MPDLRPDTSGNYFHRLGDDAAGAWLSAAVAIAIMIGLTAFL
jgi:hypothetical protein